MELVLEMMEFLLELDYLYKEMVEQMLVLLELLLLMMEIGIKQT